MSDEVGTKNEKSEATRTPKSFDYGPNMTVLVGTNTVTNLASGISTLATTAPSTSTLDGGKHVLPPLPQPELLSEDDVFRWMRQNVPMKWLYWLRDSGFFRWLVDTLSLQLAVQVLRDYPTALADYIFLSAPWAWMRQRTRKLAQLSGAGCQLDTLEDVNFQRLSYGDDPRQVIDLFKPITAKGAAPSTHGNHKHDQFSEEETEPWVVFVHGGAWGSGFPALYRLVSVPFLRRSRTVAIIGYRTYPTANVNGQVDDVSRALHFLAARATNHNKPNDGPPKSAKGCLCVVGHSSGAHISTLALLSLRRRGGMDAVTKMIALGLVADIPAHYRYEKQRGVERISPLAPACFGERVSTNVAATAQNDASKRSISNAISILKEWKKASPTFLVEGLWHTTRNSTNENESVLDELPPMIICHGGNDTVVPYTSSLAFFTRLEESSHTIVRPHMKGREGRFSWELLPDVGHSEMCLQLMFGGPTRDAVVEWVGGK